MAVAVGRNGNRPGVWTYNNTSWSRVPKEKVDSGTGTMRAVAVAGNAVIAVGSIVQRANDIDGMVWRRSADGRWTHSCEPEVCGGAGRQDILAVAPMATGRFIAVGRKASGGDFDGAVWRSRDDGLTWEPVADDGSLGGDLNQTVKGVVAIGNRIVAVGSSGRSGAVWTSTSGGDTWKLVPAGAAFSRSGERVELLAVARLERGGGSPRLVAVGRETNHDGKSAAAAWFSRDGVEWTKATIRNARFSGQQMIALVAAQLDLVAVGNAAKSRRVRKLGHSDLQGNLAPLRGRSSQCSERPRGSFRETRCSHVHHPIPSSGRRSNRKGSASSAAFRVMQPDSFEPRPEL